MRSIKSRISSTRQAVTFSESLTGLGNLPSRTPCHHVDRETGMVPFGAMTLFNRTKPSVGSPGIVFSVILLALRLRGATTAPSWVRAFDYAVSKCVQCADNMLTCTINVFNQLTGMDAVGRGE